MVFSSGVFLFLFLPVVILLHTVIRNNKIRNGMLIVASLIFYAYGEPVYILLLLASVVVNYFFGRAVAQSRSKAVLVIAVIFNIGVLVVFKYTGFIVETINCLPGINIPVPKITMPIGISFFTFQAVSYVIDTYRSEERKAAGFLDVLLYISLFPQLIAGPIVKYNSIKEALADRKVTVDGLTTGIRRFIVGLSKKMLIANAMGYVADTVFALDAGTVDTPLAWLGAVCYTLQIYFDFSGYSDMALGLGNMMGFSFPENFRYPYVASGIRDFWRRWHMSLTGWFREYLYIPLGGNRKGLGRQIINGMIVFLCTGIWHGANATFIVWGLFHGVLISAETLIFRKKKEQKFNPFKWIYTIILVIIGFVIFRADTMGYAVTYIGKMFAFVRTDSAYITMMSMLTPVFLLTLGIAVIASTPIVPWIRNKTAGTALSKGLNTATYVVVLGLFFLCVMTLAANSYNPFIYFRF